MNSCVCDILAKKRFFLYIFYVYILYCPFLVLAQDLKKIDSLQNVLKKEKRDSLRCQIYADIGDEYAVNQPDSSFKYDQKALQLALKVGNKRLYANIHKHLIHDYMFFGKFAEAIAASDTALKIYTALKDEVGLADVYDQTAYVYDATGKRSKQYDYIFKAIELYEKNENEEGKAFAYSHLGVTYVSNDQFIKALPFLQKAFNIMQRKGSQDGISVTASNIGYLYLRQHRYDSAEIYLRQSLRASLKTQSWRNILGDFVNLAEMNIKKKKYKQAEDTLLLALRKAEEIKVNYQITPILSRLADLYIATKNYTQAINYAEKLIVISQEIQDAGYEADGYRILAEIYEITGQDGLALRYLKKQLMLGDTLWQEGNQEEITDLTIKYAVNQKEKENILLKLNLERQKREQYIWVSGLLFLLIFSMALGYGFWQRSKNLKNQRLAADREKQIFEKENIILVQLQEQQDIKHKALEFEILAQQEINKLEQEKLQESIDSKSRALATLAIAMVQKNSILQDLKEKINENSKSKASFDSKIKDILSDIDNSMDMEEEWKTFKQHFEDVHPDFFVRLDKLCPELTPHEVRFCTYIKMNISAKDIAQMMNVTNRAIQMNRHRIKKKFGLDEEVDFINFVRNI